MDCANESRVIEAALRACAGVSAVRFDLLRQRVTITFDHATLSPATLAAAIRRAGFAPRSDTPSSPRMPGSIGREWAWAGAAGALFLVAFAFANGYGPRFPGLAAGYLAKGFFAASMLLSARFFVLRAWRALRQWQADMNVLVTLAALGALLLGDWVEAALVALLFAVAHLLEAAASAHTRKSIERFLHLMPATAERLFGDNGATETVLVQDLRVGDLLLVKPGARVPADGVVESGWSSIDQSALTGEALPVDVQQGSTVYAGSTNGAGALRIRATRDAAHSRAARLEDTILQAQALRSPVERWVERFARVYTPAVLLLAALVAILPPLAGASPTEWFYNALVLLLIACPCALVISTPVTMVSSISALARMGVLVRGGETVERAAAVRAVAFDKTGVLTRGSLQVRELRCMPGVQPEVAIPAAAALETMSEHPVARALVDYATSVASQGATSLPAASAFHALPGLGGEGIVEGLSVWVGSPLLARQRGAWNDQAQAVLDALHTAGGAIVAAGSGSALWFLASLSDTPRAEAPVALRHLQAAGYQRLAMLSGDHPANCKAVAQAVGIGEIHASLLPEDKLSTLRAMEAAAGPVAMVGDGINDAPAMAAASLSIAAGDRASDVTLQAADAVIWDGDLRRVPLLFRTARQAMRIVRQNVLFAVGSKAAVALLAALGLATLGMAVLADVGATVLVTLNGLRLLQSAQGREIETRSACAAPSTSS